MDRHSFMNVSHEALRSLTKALLLSRKVRDDVAGHVCDSLMQTSLRGVDSHGIELLPHYIRALDAGRINPSPDYLFEPTGPATGRLNADHTFGHAAGGVGMQRAIAMAREAGTGMVAVHNSSHFGAAAYFALLAANEGLLALSFTNADALMLSYGGRRGFFGTNPICFAAPCADEAPFCLDMATTLVSWNKILRHRLSGDQLGQGWAFDEEADLTMDAAAARTLAPIGLYKGFGLAMMVDVLCGVLTGMPFGREISRMYADPIEQRRLLGHFFVAIDPARFIGADAFREGMQRMMTLVRAEPPLSEGAPVMVPGDPEKGTEAVRMQHGIPLSDGAVAKFRELAAETGVGSF
jgi:ureidoglycolate dehydrogenase (NAD+)